MSFAVAPPGAGFGAPAATLAGRAVGGLGALSEAAYRRSDEIRRSIAVPEAHGAGNPAAGATLAGALAGFVASPAGHAALERLANAGSGWLERALGLAGAAEQLSLPLA